jgi:hypothetical protein
MAKKYIELNVTTGRLQQRQATDTSAGAGNAGDVIALDSSGKIDASLLPSGATGSGTVLAIQCTENLAAGDWVNVFNNSGTKACRKALATDTTKPAHGYVVQAYTSGASANVYFGGMNAVIPLGSFAVGDIGSRVFLSPSTSGATTKTCPSTTGNLVQPVGSVIDVTGSEISVEVDFGEQVVV